MIINLSLLIYTALEIQLREALKITDETLPNQSKKTNTKSYKEVDICYIYKYSSLYMNDQK